MRLRGNLSVASLGTLPSSFTVGIIKASTGSPTSAPSSSPQLDWLWWYRGLVVGGSAGDVQQFEIDSKAMRKIAPGEDLRFAFANDGAGSEIVYSLGVRILIKSS